VRDLRIPHRWRRERRGGVRKGEGREVGEKRERRGIEEKGGILSLYFTLVMGICEYHVEM
jgi:hypothetical protein